MDKVSKRNIRKGSAAFRILEILWSYPEVQRKHIGIANGNYSEEQVSRAAKYLLDTGCIETETNSKGAVIYRLGKKGLNFLEDETDYYYDNRQCRPSWEQQEADARARRLETECMFAGIGVRVMPSEKPMLADSITAMTDYIWEEGENKNGLGLYGCSDAGRM